MSSEPTPSDFGELKARVTSVETEVKGLRALMQENTKITEEIRDAIPTIKNVAEIGVFAKIGKRIILGAAALVVAVAGLYQGWKSVIAHILSTGGR